MATTESTPKEAVLDQRQTQHKIGLTVSLLGLGLFVFFGKGVVLYGALMGFGMFATLLLVGLRTPKILRWANDHAAATEIITTSGTFVLFQFVGGGTVTAGIASAVVCLLVSAVLGCSKLGFLDRLIGKATEGIAEAGEVILERLQSDEKPEKATLNPNRLRTKKVRRQSSGNQILQAAIARAVIKGA